MRRGGSEGVGAGSGGGGGRGSCFQNMPARVIWCRCIIVSMVERPVGGLCMCTEIMDSLVSSRLRGEDGLELSEMADVIAHTSSSRDLNSNSALLPQRRWDQDGL